LRSDGENTDLVKQWVLKDLHQSQGEKTNEEVEAIGEERFKKILEWRKLVNSELVDREEDRSFCISALGRLISAQFSGKAQSYAAVEWTLIRLLNSIVDRKPITVTYCFGGYKNHHSPSFPEVDWAELFHLNYLVSFLYPIIKNYKHGVEIEYESEEVSIQFNNVPQSKTDQYSNTFRKLIKYYSSALLSSYGLEVPISICFARDLYGCDINELYRLIDEKKSSYLSIFNGLNSFEKEKWIQRAAYNFLWDNGIKSYGNLTDSERYEIYLNARITNEAFLEADYVLRGEWFENKYRIPITGTWGRMPSAQPIDGWLHIKSTESSLVDFWIGTGVLEFTNANLNDSYREEILSKTQYDKIKARIEYLGNQDSRLIDVSHNFEKIPYYITNEVSI
jgi:hypothetical protein